MGATDAGNSSKEDFSSDNFFEDVATVLGRALEREPDRQDLRYKLLEVYAALGQRERFVRLAHEYRRRLEKDGTGDWEKVAALGRALFVERRHIDGDDQESNDAARGKRLGDRPGDEPLNRALAGLSEQYKKLREDPDFLAEVDRRVSLLTGQPPPPLYHAARLGRENGGARIHLAREEAHDVLGYKVANALGQGLTALRLGLTRLIAASTSGQQGVATAIAAAHLGLACTVHMRAEEIRSQNMRSDLIRKLGAELRALPEDRRTPFIASDRAYGQVLNRVRDAALDDWLGHADDSLFVNGLAAAPEPYPTMQRDFHAGTARAVRHRLLADYRKLPATVIAVLDGSLDPLNFFHAFLPYRSVALVGVETTEMQRHRERRQRDRYQHPEHMLFSADQVAAADVILHAQGFPSTRREHAWLRDTGRVRFVESGDEDARKAIETLARTEGLVLNEASGHGLARALRLAAAKSEDEDVVVLVETITENQPGGLT